MIYSKQGLALTESFESCQLTAYADPVRNGIPTIGYGHTGPDVHLGMTCTLQQAQDWLEADIHWAANVVSNTVHVSLTQGEFDALVDLCFNIGAHAFATSTLVALLNASDFNGAALEIDKWDHANGKVIAGLLRRREAETAMFNGLPNNGN